jgi:hypothetical protein
MLGCEPEVVEMTGIGVRRPNHPFSWRAGKLFSSQFERYQASDPGMWAVARIKTFVHFQFRACVDAHSKMVGRQNSAWQRQKITGENRA